MRLPPLLLAALLAACAKGPPLERRIESALMERLLQARGSDEGVVLTDDTPRANIPERPKEGSRLVFIRGASFQAPLEGLKGLAVSAGDEGLRVRLDYGTGTIEILDGSGAPADREFERLGKVGEGLGEEILRGFGGPLASEPGAAEKIEHWRGAMAAYDKQFSRRFDKAHQLRRSALQASASRVPEDPEESYRDCRLLRVKRELIAAMGGGPEPAAYAVAAGPTVGIRRGLPGKDAEVRSMSFGPDGMAVRTVVSGPLAEALVLEIVNSFRPFAESRSIARRIVGKPDAEPLDAALAAMSALHLDPSSDNAVQFLHTLAPVQPDRGELAAGLALWLKADGAKRERIVAAAQ